jgi:hypothetical protein
LLYFPSGGREAVFDTARIRRNPWMTALASAPWAAILVLGVIAALTGVPLWVIFPHLAIIGAFTFLANWRRKWRARRAPVRACR